MGNAPAVGRPDDDTGGIVAQEQSRSTAEFIQAWDQAAWSLAALALRGAADASPRLRASADDVLSALGLLEGPGGGLVGVPPQAVDPVASQAAAPLLLTSALVAGADSAWTAQSDAALLAQGRMSSQMAAAFRQHLLPALPGLDERLATSGARMLDVGTGVGALAVAFAETFPQLTVVGIDVLARVLALANRTISESGVADRVSVREQDLATLSDEGLYDLAWLPAPFVPPGPLEVGVGRIATALRPGGWLIMGHGKFSGDPVEDALNRFKTTAYGGTAVTDQDAQARLTEAHLENIATLPTPPGAPALTVGQRVG
jgi:protein-L-isoaspartate O-methyltransferase